MGLLQGLANATIAKSYLKQGGSGGGGDDHSSQARWRKGEKALHAQLEVGLWTQRVQHHKQLQAQLRHMDNAVAGLQETLDTLRGSSEGVRGAFAHVNLAYVEELLAEAVQALAEEGKMRRDILSKAGKVADHEVQLLYVSAWAGRPLLQEHRRRALQDLVKLELTASDDRPKKAACT